MYGVVKLAALSAALAASLVTVSESRRSGPNAAHRVMIDAAPISRNAPLATDDCADLLSGLVEAGCPIEGAALAAGTLRLSLLEARLVDRAAATLAEVVR